VIYADVAAGNPADGVVARIGPTDAQAGGGNGDQAVDVFVGIACRRAGNRDRIAVFRSNRWKFALVSVAAVVRHRTFPRAGQGCRQRLGVMVPVADWVITV
jgi:hypothetical protein